MIKLCGVLSIGVILLLISSASGTLSFEPINQNSFRVILTGSDYQNARNNPVYYADQISSYAVDKYFGWVQAQEYLDQLIERLPEVVTAPIYPMVKANKYSPVIIREGIAWKAGTVLQEANNWYNTQDAFGGYDGIYIDVIKRCQSPACPADWRWTPVPAQSSQNNNAQNSNAQFRVTSGSYSETANLDQAVKNEFGNDYSVADWTDITAHSGDIQNWANSIGMNHNDYYFVTRNRQGFWNGGNRHYFVTRFDHVVDNNYLVHDQINNNHMIKSCYEIVSIT